MTVGDICQGLGHSLHAKVPPEDEVGADTRSVSDLGRYLREVDHYGIHHILKAVVHCNLSGRLWNEVRGETLAMIALIEARQLTVRPSRAVSRTLELELETMPHIAWTAGPHMSWNMDESNSCLAASA